MTELSRLPLPERIKLYREHAIKALKTAEASTTSIERKQFLFIALQWEDLAKDAEAKLLKQK